MDHVIAHLDADHDRVCRDLAHDLAGVLGLDGGTVVQSRPHITLVSYTGLDPEAALAALGPVADRAGPVPVRAHGYGMFTGDEDSDLSLHVMVVRSRPLDELHRHVGDALAAAGAELSGATRPSVWSPHITLLDRGLTPALLGRAVEVLAGRPHRSWTIPLTALAVARRSWEGRPAPDRAVSLA